MLLLSHYAEAHYLMRILEIGTEAIGYRLKDRIASADALRDTLVRVSAGEIVIEPAVAGRLVGKQAARTDGLDSLTSREIMVLRLMAEGAPTPGSPGRSSCPPRRSRSTWPPSSPSSACPPMPPATIAGCSPS